jgi:hypothetical protein
MEREEGESSDSDEPGVLDDDEVQLELAQNRRPNLEEAELIRLRLVEARNRVLETGRRLAEEARQREVRRYVKLYVCRFGVLSSSLHFWGLLLNLFGSLYSAWRLMQQQEPTFLPQAIFIRATN